MDKRPPSSPLHPLRRAFGKALRTACKRSRRKAERLAAEVAEADLAEDVLQQGEILKANLDRIPRGTSSVRLPDPYHEGREREIPLDPRRKPMENAKRYFKRHRKLKRAKAVKERQLTSCKEEGDRLAALLSEYETWSAEADPEALPDPDLVTSARALRVHVGGIGGAEARTGPGRSAAASPQVREFVSLDGLPILVGKTARANDTLSLRTAKGNDWWFHLAHETGSHVVVRSADRTGNGGEKIADKKRRRQQHALPQETLLDAAHLAIYFSKSRRATKAEVHYTQAKHVRKAKGAPSGQVLLREHRSVLVRVEKLRLQRLLGREEPLTG